MIQECRVPRSEVRRRVFMTATLIDIDGPQEVRIRDLTDAGARIACARPVSRGGDVMFRRGSLMAAARVTWSDGDEAGIEFYRPVPANRITAA